MNVDMNCTYDVFLFIDEYVCGYVCVCGYVNMQRRGDEEDDIFSYSWVCREGRR